MSEYESSEKSEIVVPIPTGYLRIIAGRMVAGRMLIHMTQIRQRVNHFLKN